MLEKPQIKDSEIARCLEDQFDLRVRDISFLPLGADPDTAVYRVVAEDEAPYFLKLRRGDVDTAAVAIPRFLSQQGMAQVIAPLATVSGQLWASLPPFKVILYPFVEGRHGYEAKLSEQQWVHFGATLKRFHTARVPPEITEGIPRETFSPKWREIVRSHLARLEEKAFNDPVATEMAAFLRARREETLMLIRRADRLAQALQANPPPFILCHGDIHGWNLLLDDAGRLHIVDWDTLIFAPKERDLMFIGAGLGDSDYTPREEESLFYRGYGRTDVNPAALAYYRYERIVEDIAVYCEQIFLSDEGGQDRRQSLAYLKSNYLPGSTIETAVQSDKT